MGGAAVVAVVAIAVPVVAAEAAINMNLPAEIQEATTVCNTPVGSECCGGVVEVCMHASCTCAVLRGLSWCWH